MTLRGRATVFDRGRFTFLGSWAFSQHWMTLPNGIDRLRFAGCDADGTVNGGWLGLICALAQGKQEWRDRRRLLALCIPAQHTNRLQTGGFFWVAATFCRIRARRRYLFRFHDAVREWRNTPDWTKTGSNRIRRHNLVTNAALSDLYAVTSHVGAIAETAILNEAGEILTLSDGTIVTFYRDGSNSSRVLIHLSAAGDVAPFPHVYVPRRIDQSHLTDGHGFDQHACVVGGQPRTIEWTIRCPRPLREQRAVIVYQGAV
jgi:hypothetical protein